jgi:hypothetical protein
VQEKKENQEKITLIKNITGKYVLKRLRDTLYKSMGKSA